MKKLFLLLTLCALSGAAQAQSLESKIERAGHMPYVKVSGLKSTVRDGLLTLQLELANEDSAAQSVQWRVRWLDTDGFVVGGEEVWKPELLQANQRRTFQTVAPGRKASDFKIELRSPDATWGPATTQ